MRTTLTVLAIAVALATTLGASNSWNRAGDAPLASNSWS